jgi:uncharacterized membrane protein
MNRKNFSIKAAFIYGWKMTLKNFGFIFLSFLLEAALSIGMQIVVPGRHRNNFWAHLAYFPHGFQFLSFSILFALTILGILFHIGFLRLSLDLTHGKPAIFRNILSYEYYFWPFIGTTLLVAILFFVGVIFLIIPGIILGLMFSSATIATIDLDLNPLAALVKSRELARGVKWKLLGFYMILGVLNFFGATAFVIGLLVTVPISIFAILYVYRELLTQIERPADIFIPH